MAKNVRVKLDRKGMGALMRGAEMRGMVRKSGDRIAAAAGEGISADTWIAPEPGRSGQPRAVSGVQADSRKGYQRQRRDNVILRARDAGRV